MVYNNREKNDSREGISMKNILFVASESVPFIKTGGLADVVGSLPKCFNREECRVGNPGYDGYPSPDT